MPTPHKRLTFLPDTHALAVLGYDPAASGQTACAVGPTRTLARLVQRAARELPFTGPEWNAMADVLNGSYDLYDYAETAVPPKIMITSNLQDAPGIGERWGIDVKALVATVNSLSDLHAEAVLAAVRWAWQHVDRWDLGDEWWTPEHRTATRPA